MASTYVNDLRLNEMATGDQSGAWGTVTNTNLELIGDAFGYATEAITTNADTHATVIANGAADAGRAMVLKYTGTLDSACTITISGGDASTFTVSKLWYIHNATSGSQNIIITSGSGANITIANGQTKCVYTDGAGSGGAVIDTFAALSVVDLFVDDDLTVTDDLIVGGIVSLADGTAGAPSLTNTGDVNAGLFFSAADTLAFSAGGTAQFTMADGVIAPVTDSDVDLGTNSLRFKDVYIDSATVTGEVAAATLDISGAIDVAGNSVLASVDVTGLATAATFEPDGDTAAGDNAAVGYTAAEGLILTGQGSTNDVTIKNDADADVLEIPTGTTNVAVAGNITSGGAAVKVAGLETIWVPAAAMYPSTTNPCSDLTQVETTALRPDMKVLDFAADADDFAQFSIGFPKSWNEGVIKFQVFWTPSTTNTGDCIWGLQGVSVADGATIDVAFGTAVTVTDAGIGTVEDQQVSAVSGDVTLTNAAVDTQTYFQIFRDANAGGDTFTGVSRLLGIKLFFTTDAANDA
ncbi:MAG: hypothetical protein HN804_04610 [Oceanospirillaceae bacterium]|nr:hypothetical protein [Oceanospirillaceae bacterium]